MISSFNNLYRRGFAVIVYDIDSDTRTWRYFDQKITLPTGDVVEQILDGVRVAPIDEVMDARQRMKETQ